MTVNLISVYVPTLYKKTIESVYIIYKIQEKVKEEKSGRGMKKQEAWKDGV